MSLRFRLSALVALMVIAALTIVIIPGLAQDMPAEEELTIVTGAVEFTADGNIMVAGVVIAPSSAFNPSTLQPGDIVVIFGTLNPDGTLKAVSLELFDGDLPEATPEATLEVTPELTPEATPEVTPELTPEATLEVTPELTPEATPEATLAPDCNRPDHPVAQAIADTYGVPYAEVMNFHCSGMGFGNIVRAYALAEASGGAAKDYLERHQKGEGWGNIRKDSDVDPSELAPGKIMKPCKKGCEDAVEPPPAPTEAPPVDARPGNGNNDGNPGQGNDKDKDKDKGNNGNDGGNNGNNDGNNGNGGDGGNGGGKGKK